jgi:hypothetical protein
MPRLVLNSEKPPLHREFMEFFHVGKASFCIDKTSMYKVDVAKSEAEQSVARIR